MSAPAAGKFQDHYEVLGIDPKADDDAIRAAHAELSRKHSGDAEKLESLSLALEVLLDADLRRNFNKLKGIENQEVVRFNADFFDAVSRDAGVRMTLLCLLYDRRRTKSYTPSMSNRQLEAMLDVSPEEMAFAVWYLKQRSLVTNDDKSALQITVAGIDLVDRERPQADQVLPFIKESARTAPARSKTAANIMGMLRRDQPEAAN
jgi:curved DNA-binding protein CbpA